MNKALKIFLIVLACLAGLALLVGGGILLGRSLGSGIRQAAGQLGLEPGEQAPRTNITEDFGTAATSLDLEIGAGSFTLAEGDRFQVEAEGVDPDSFSCQMQGGTLVIRTIPENAGSGSAAQLLQQLGYNPKVTITIPAGVQLEEVDLTLQAGELKLCDLNCASFSLDMAAGALKGGALHAGTLELELAAGAASFRDVSADRSTLALSAGAIELASLSSPTAELEVSLGSLEIGGLRCQDLSAQCETGSIALTLLEKEANCRMEMDISAGNVLVNGRSYTSETRLGAQDAPCRLELEVSTGQIQIDFQ